MPDPYKRTREGLLAMTVQVGSQQARVIDIHCHLAPADWSRPTAPACMFDIEGLIEEQLRGGVDVSVFGNNWIRVPEGMTAIEAVKRYNAFAAEATAKYPEHLL